MLVNGGTSCLLNFQLLGELSRVCKVSLQMSKPGCCGIPPTFTSCTILTRVRVKSMTFRSEMVDGTHPLTYTFGGPARLGTVTLGME
jgi:hypothetical protein